MYMSCHALLPNKINVLMFCLCLSKLNVADQVKGVIISSAMFLMRKQVQDADQLWSTSDGFAEFLIEKASEDEVVLGCTCKKSKS